MNGKNIPDVTDPEIRQMVEFNHEPRELWTLGGDLLGVICRTCGHRWPCPTIVALRATPPPDPSS